MLKTSKTNYNYFIKKTKSDTKVHRVCRPKNCLSCRAYQKNKCVLKYETRVVSILPNGEIYHGPVIRCPKPTTWRDYDKWLMKKKKKS